MICTQCGKVTEFNNEQLQADIEGTKLPRFRQTHYSLYVYGLCSRCQWKQTMKLNSFKRQSKAESASKAVVKGKADAKDKKTITKKKQKINKNIKK